MSVIQATQAAETLGDEDLVRMARARDEAAVRAITKRYNRRLFRIARSILRNDAEAEDVVQETYVRAFTGLDMFRGDAAFGTWITRIAMNEALGRLRKRRPTVDWETYGTNRNEAEIINFPISAAGSDPEKAMAQSEIRLVLEHAIDELRVPVRVRRAHSRRHERRRNGGSLWSATGDRENPATPCACPAARGTRQAARPGAHQQFPVRRLALRAHDGNDRRAYLR